MGTIEYVAIVMMCIACASAYTAGYSNARLRYYRSLRKYVALWHKEQHPDILNDLLFNMIPSNPWSRSKERISPFTSKEANDASPPEH